MTNPYQAPNVVSEAAPLYGDAQSRRVPVQPIGRLKDALDLMGDQYLLFVGICFVAVLINSVAQNLLVGSFACGVYLCFDDRMNGQRTTFERMFKGFEFFLPSFLATLLMFGFAILLTISLVMSGFVVIGVIGALGQGNPDLAGAVFAMGIVLFVVGVVAVSLTIYVPFVFVFPLIVDRRMNAWEAVKTSWGGARKNLWGIVGMLVLYGLIAMASTMMCYIPLFFVIPLQVGAFSLLYRDVFPNAAPARVDGQNVYPT